MLRVTLLCAVSVATAGAACPSYAGRPNVGRAMTCGPSSCRAKFTFPFDEKVPPCIDPCGTSMPANTSLSYHKVTNGTNLTVDNGYVIRTFYFPCNECLYGYIIICSDDGAGGGAGGSGDDSDSNTVVIIVGVLCGLLVLVAAAGGVWWYVKRQQRAIIASQELKSAEAGEALVQSA